MATSPVLIPAQPKSFLVSTAFYRINVKMLKTCADWRFSAVWSLLWGNVFNFHVTYWTSSEYEPEFPGTTCLGAVLTQKPVTFMASH